MTGSPDRSSAKITSVLLCSDVLATRESEQDSNLQWFADLLARPIGQALPDADIRRGLGAGFERAEVLLKAVGKTGLKQRHCWFDPDVLDANAAGNLRKAIGENTLVVGYEMSGWTRKALSDQGISWIDIWLHPVRFADDILFAVRASDAIVQARIDRFSVADESVAAQADVLRVQGYRGFSKVGQTLVPGSALFVGQTSNDKSVLDRRGFLGLLDFQDEFANLARRHPHVYFSRHPHQPYLPPEVRAFVESFGNVTETPLPTYHLLADDRIASVASISSSVLEEARYFGKDVVRFHPAPYPLAGDGRYRTILHSPCFSHFWADILQDVANVAPTEPAGFIDPRNKLRHALSFTWGYGDIDKYEQGSDEAQAAAGEKPGGVKVETADLVSFDVFDTLITRRFASPRDVFELVANDAVAISGGQASEFPEHRLQAEKQATEIAGRSGREDPMLSEIYAALLGVDTSDPRVARLCQLEIAAEMKVVLPRPAGAMLYRRALRAGQHIALVSDTYLPRETVAGLLTECGYEGWEELYVSSETGSTKRTGSMFERLLSDTGLTPDRILHIGDNPKGDDEVPRQLGISAKPLPRAVENMRNAAPFFRTAVARMSNDGIVGGSEYLAQIATRHFDDAGSATGADGFGRDPEVFGYVVLGPLLTGFVDWLNRVAIEQGVEKLGFLTREGSVLRSAYEVLNPESQIETSTVIASRRIVRNADDPRTEAREILSQYLREMGLAQGKVGVVDIGYAGQIQAGFSDISGNRMSGFYLATFRTSKEILGDLPSKALLASGMAANDKKHGICRHRQIYETLLCSPGPSYVGVERDGDGWRGVTVQEADTPIRDEFVRAAHKGALEFVAEYARNRASSARVSPAAATSLLDALLDDPTPGLADWLGQLEFDDSFDEDAMSKLIAPEGSTSRSVWTEGARVLGAKPKARGPAKRGVWQPLGPYGVLGWRHALTPVVARFVGRIGDEKDADHFRDDPIGFFRRLSDPRYRRIGRILYPWD